MNAWPENAQPELCLGHVFHKRLRPVQHQFSYRVFFLRLPLSRLNELGNRWLSKDRFNLLSFFTRDYGPRDGSSLQLWMRDLLLREGIDSADGEIVLQTFPRLLGYVFNPISIWYCFDQRGQLRASLAEVRNTFGEIHSYVLPVKPGELSEAGLLQQQEKLFYVSPYIEMAMRYHFHLSPPGERVRLRILETDREGPLLAASFSGRRRDLTTAALLRSLVSLPLLPFKIVAAIHWEALRLWLKGARLVRRPDAAFDTGLAAAESRDYTSAALSVRAKQ